MPTVMAGSSQLVLSRFDQDHNEGSSAAGSYIGAKIRAGDKQAEYARLAGADARGWPQPTGGT
eukprot:COSAG06_NODE_781_length_12364_cov_6.388912_8_plen_63_part_00